MGTTRRFGISIAGVAAVLLLSASAAEAARFASPSGSGTTCTQASPCAITVAVNNAPPGDDVTIEPGNYGPLTSTSLSDGGNTLTIHGQAGAPRPVITFSTVSDGFVIDGPGSSLSNVEVDTTSAFETAILVGGTASADRVIGHAFAADSLGCELTGPVILTNSVCVADGSGPSYGAEVISTGSPTLRNDTLEAPGGSGSSGGVALWVRSTIGSATTANLTNVIARGAQEDLLAQTISNPSSEAVINADHSNYANAQMMNGGGGSTVMITPAGSGTNQTAAPQFVNPGADQFQEAAGSPTISAGFSSPANGLFDLDGNPRQVKGSTDIGAYQFIAPPTCQPASATTAFGQATTLQLQCADVLGAAVSYAIVSKPAHGTVSLNAASGQAIYTPAAGYSGPDSFTFNATSSNGTGAAATATITVTKPPAPSDSVPKLSPSSFAALSSGGSVITATTKGTIISYTDSQAATTTFVIRQPAGKGVLSHGKCVKRPHGRPHGSSCTRYKKIGSFSHADTAGENRFGFTGRVNGHKLKLGHYQLLSTPVNSVGESGATHTSNFRIKP